MSIVYLIILDVNNKNLFILDSSLIILEMCYH